MLAAATSIWSTDWVFQCTFLVFSHTCRQDCACPMPYVEFSRLVQPATDQKGIAVVRQDGQVVCLCQSGYRHLHSTRCCMFARRYEADAPPITHSPHSPHSVLLFWSRRMRLLLQKNAQKSSSWPWGWNVHCTLKQKLMYVCASRDA